MIYIHHSEAGSAVAPDSKAVQGVGEFAQERGVGVGTRAGELSRHALERGDCGRSERAAGVFDDELQRSPREQPARFVGARAERVTASAGGIRSEVSGMSFHCSGMDFPSLSVVGALAQDGGG